MRRDLCLAANELAPLLFLSLPSSFFFHDGNMHSESIKDKLNVISYDDEMKDEEEFVNEIKAHLNDCGARCGDEEKVMN